MAFVSVYIRVQAISLNDAFGDLIALGFNPPVINRELTPLQGPIPNVIALPYGRCPPFHLKAPSWRDLLKLMARLSGTRLEPTIEALAAVKTEMRVRVVVNFVKVRPQSFMGSL